MTRSPVSFILLCSLLLLTAKPAWTKDASSTTDESVKSVKMALGAWRGTQLMGVSVYTSDGDHVGAIADIVGDIKGQIIYVILSHGGFLGIGDKLIPLPWELLIPGKRSKSLEIQLSKKDLERAPNFDSNFWPDFTQSEWQTKTKKYYESFGKEKKGKSH
jgi:sporulation protein YlmC with PRC-barrel domain